MPFAEDILYRFYRSQGLVWCEETNMMDDAEEALLHGPFTDTVDAMDQVDPEPDAQVIFR